MKNENIYKGVIAPVITPFNENGTIDEQSAVRICEFLLENSMSIFLLGTTGEALSMSNEMRFQLVKLIMKEISDPGVLYVGISDHAFDNTIEAAKKYHDVGAHAFVAHLPCYYPLTPEAMLRYYETLANESPSPIMLYNVPGTTKISIPLDVIEKLSYHPNIIGLKDSERGLERLQILIDKFGKRDDFVLMCGWTVKSTETLLMGFDGIVPSTCNVIPEKFNELYTSVQRGDEKRALELQQFINPMAELHQKDKTVSWAIAGLKVMSEELGLCGPWMRSPLLRLHPEEEKQLREGFRKLNQI